MMLRVDVSVVPNTQEQTCIPGGDLGRLGDNMYLELRGYTWQPDINKRFSKTSR